MPVLQLIFSGLAIGAVYALLATGHSLIYRSTRTINFALGEFSFLAGYVAYDLAGGGSSLATRLLSGIAAVALIAALSMIIEVVAFRPVYSSGPIYVIVSSIALVFVLQTVMLVRWGSRSVSVDRLVPGTFSVGPATLNYQQLIIIVALALAVPGLISFFRRPLGIQMRASAEAPATAQLYGVSFRRTATMAYGLGGLLAGLGGVLVAPLTLLTPSGGAQIGLLALVGAIVGGLGRISGALLGGVSIGLLQVFLGYFVGGTIVRMMLFGSLILILLLRPQGIIAEEGGVVRA